MKRKDTNRRLRRTGRKRPHHRILRITHVPNERSSSNTSFDVRANDCSCIARDRFSAVVGRPFGVRSFRASCGGDLIGGTDAGVLFVRKVRP